ncbi:hypothetical protein OIU76_030104 [Salix suchowensis]|nr:hypothetical protein OIU76_030104 [Salix suchowensis]
MAFGYAYPAYECFKVTENSRTETVQFLFWCRYWLPMYSEAKLAFFIYLWHPKTKGTEYVYNCFFRPFMAKHETGIDRNLLEMRVQAEEIALIYWQKAAAYGQTKFFEILLYVSSQSSLSMPRSVQEEPNAATVKQPKEPDEQSHEPASKLEEQPGETMQSLENGDVNSPRQETAPKESVQIKHGRWKLFQRPQKPSNS